MREIVLHIIANDGGRVERSVSFYQQTVASKNLIGSLTRYACGKLSLESGGLLDADLFGLIKAKSG